MARLPPAPRASAAPTVVLTIPFVPVQESLNRWQRAKSRKFSYVLSPRTGQILAAKRTFQRFAVTALSRRSFQLLEQLERGRSVARFDDLGIAQLQESPRRRSFRSRCPIHIQRGQPRGCRGARSIAAQNVPEPAAPGCPNSLRLTCVWRACSSSGGSICRRHRPHSNSYS